ncbi:hypothetical protein L1987_08460 [Smallanthus sonchifolius]|uniref:Uncharacterized protein n=1 Tax=Smallanthus sonchifolius TaxID=185202 RepID=A0ACB9JMM8_9ASTR|nr:hypothetical protein L1987_08460 [Smallanthus sonchifolius]
MELNGTNNQSEVRHESWTLGHARLKARVDLLQKNQRNLMGEDLDSLSLKELQNLEQQLETYIRHLILKKNRSMLESISKFQKKCTILNRHVLGFEPIWSDVNGPVEETGLIYGLGGLAGSATSVGCWLGLQFQP